MGHSFVLTVRSLILAVCCLSASAVVAETPRTLPQSERDDLMRRLEASLGDIQSLRATFVQAKHLSIFQDVVRTTGTLYFAAPNRVRIQMNEPFESVLIADGRAVAQFERIDGTWQRIRSGGQQVILAVTGQIASWMQGDFEAQSDMYTITAETDGDTVLILTPTDPDFAERIARIEITVAADLKTVTRIEIREPGGDYTALIFDRQERDLDLPTDLFRTDAPQPAPVDRIDTRRTPN